MERYISFPLGFECLWGRLQRLSIGGDTVLNLSPEDMLLISCAHGSKHLWKRLTWICDVAELIRAYEGMDWAQVMKRAGSLGSERMLYLGLCLASDLLGATLPEKALDRIQADPSLGALAGEVHERLFSETSILSDDSEVSIFEAVPFQLRMRERLRDKIWYCLLLAAVPSADDWTVLRLPEQLYSLYYLLKPIRLAIQYVPRLLKRLL